MNKDQEKRKETLTLMNPIALSKNVSLFDLGNCFTLKHSILFPLVGLLGFDPKKILILIT